MAIMITNRDHIPQSCLECEYNIDITSTYGVITDCDLGCGNVIGVGTEHYVDCRSPNCPLQKVVTCQECKHFKLLANNVGSCNYFLNRQPFSVYTNDYCSWGEKKE